jgi:tryptophan-rich sensory protein
MSVGYAVIISVVTCAAAAALEGACAGKNVKSFYAQLRFPHYSAPLAVWAVIGGLYYVIFCFVLYRLLRLDGGSGLRVATLALMVFMMVVNALTNYAIFRARNLRLSFIIGSLFPALDVALFACMLRLDSPAAWALIPYLLYRLYALWWGYWLWKVNDGRAIT